VDTLLDIGLGNALAAAVLALLVAALSRLCRRPAVIHALWLVVLLKLITPPLWTISLQWPAKIAAAAPETPALAAGEEPKVLSSSEYVAASPSSTPTMLAEESAPLRRLSPWTDELPVSVPESAQPTETPPAQPSWRPTILLVWLIGSAVWWTLAGLRLYRFQRLLRFGWAAPTAVQEQAARLAGRIGLRRCPEVWFLPAAVSPMLWTLIGRPRLLVPASLWERLPEAQCQALLAHELAHLRRRDHWVRWLELVVLGLYWWHPVVWWARSELRQAGEQCCDAWVVWVLPTEAPAYAAALVETAAFLSQPGPALPLMGSGAGHAQFLRRRLTMIMCGTTARALSWLGLIVVLGLAAVALPFMPTWAQTEPAAVEPAEELISDSAPAELPANLVAQAGRSTGEAPPLVLDPRPFAPRPVDRPTRAQLIEKARDEIELLKIQIEVKQAQLDMVKIGIQQAQERLSTASDLSKKGYTSSGGLQQARYDLDLQKAQFRVKEAELKEPMLLLKQAQGRLARLEGTARPATPRPNAAPRPDGPDFDSGAAADRLRERTQDIGEIQRRLAAEQDQARAKHEQMLAEMQKLSALRAVEEAHYKERIVHLQNLLDVARTESEHQRMLGVKALKDLQDKQAALEEEKRAKDKFLIEGLGREARPPEPKDPEKARLQDLEKKLGALLRQLDDLRQEMHKQAPEKRRQ
jgi:beta-lactamase regulating signal transducer with metallopeptidase domain